MNPEIASIMNFFYKIFPCKVYTKEVPENFVVPSMYFPPPFSFNSNDSLSTFRKTYSLSIKLFHKDSQQAYQEAERIADTVHQKRDIIPIIDINGNETGDFLQIRNIETRELESGVAAIQVNWDSRYFYEKEPYTPLQSVDVESGVK